MEMVWLKRSSALPSLPSPNALQKAWLVRAEAVELLAATLLFQPFFSPAILSPKPVKWLAMVRGCSATRNSRLTRFSPGGSQHTWARVTLCCRAAEWNWASSTL